MSKLDDIKARWALVTDTPWRTTAFRDALVPTGAVEELGVMSTPLSFEKPDRTWHATWICRGMTGPKRDSNAEAIAAAPADVAALLAEVERLSTKVEALEGVNRDQAVAIETLTKALTPRDYATDCAMCGEPAVTVKWRGGARYCAAHRPDGCPDAGNEGEPGSLANEETFVNGEWWTWGNPHQSVEARSASEAAVKLVKVIGIPPGKKFDVMVRCAAHPSSKKVASFVALEGGVARAIQPYDGGLKP